MSQYREVEVARLSLQIVSELAEKDDEIEVKAAALRSAASLLDNAIAMRAQAIAIHNALQNALSGSRR